ncbi:MAG: PEGA domain-containing protein [Deltaproteobacteria bacterium]|nr:PEGA domain-containing protein [Deltaproteobacteria bacterium]
MWCIIGQYNRVVAVPPAAVLGVLLIFCPAPDAGAQEQKQKIGRIVIPLDPAAALLAEDVDFKIEKILKRDERLNPAEMSTRDLESLRYDFARQAQEAMNGLAVGTAAYNDLNLDQAIILFRKAADGLAESHASARHNKDYVKALFYLGAALFSSEKKEEAREVFAQAVAYDDRLEPDQTIFPPPVIDAFNDARTRIMGELRGAVRFAAAPAGARVYVNGRYAGTTPLRVGNLPPVEAIVRLEKTGYMPVVKRVKVTPSGEEEFSVGLTELADAQAVLKPLYSLSPDALSEKLGRRGAELADATGAPLLLFVFVGAAEGGRLDAMLYNGGTLVRYATEKSPGAEPGPKDSPAVTALMAKVLAGSFVPSEGERPVIARPFYKTWWFWTAVGGAVAATTGVLLIALWPEERPAPEGGQLVITF